MRKHKRRRPRVPLHTAIVMLILLGLLLTTVMATTALNARAASQHSGTTVYWGRSNG